MRCNRCGYNSEAPIICPRCHSSSIKYFGTGTQRIEKEAVAAGVTPIRVELPVRGELFRLEKILVLEEPLWISFRYSGWKTD